MTPVLWMFLATLCPIHNCVASVNPLSQSPIMSQFWHHPVWTFVKSQQSHIDLLGVGLCMFYVFGQHVFGIPWCAFCVGGVYFFLSSFAFVSIAESVESSVRPRVGGSLLRRPQVGELWPDFFGFVNRINIQKFYLGWFREGGVGGPNHYSGNWCHSFIPLLLYIQKSIWFFWQNSAF